MLLEAKKISLTYAVSSSLSNDTNHKTGLSVLQEIDLKINEGEQWVLWGASGSGKTTLLYLLAGLLSPTSGEVYYQNKNLFQMSEKEKAHFRNTQLGFVFQFHHLLPLFNAVENVMIPLQIAGLSKQEAQERAEQCLIKVGLENRLGHYPDELSGGEQQRVAVARAVVHKPQLILADEPTGNLDSENSKIVFDLLLKMKEEQGSALVLVTHNSLLAEQLENRLSIRDGHVYSS